MEGTKNVIGLRRESKNYWERRVGLVPDHVASLVQMGIRVIVQPSMTRCFTDTEFLRAGGEINEDLSEAQLIIGIKEVPIHELLPNRTYMFFSHTLKGQSYNMPLLDALLSKNIRHIDHECIKNAQGRLVAFGTFAGNAGVIDFIQGLGKYLLMRGLANPFLYERFSYMYYSLEEAFENIRKIGKIIESQGIPSVLRPMVWGITGTGRCAEGALAALVNLPHKIISPDQLETLEESEESREVIYIVQFGTKDMYCRVNDGGFDRDEYRKQPELYRSVFKEKFSDKLAVIVNCIYYEEKYPKILTVNDLQQGTGKLLGVCDISCDYLGSVEICRKFTTPEDPFFLYNPSDNRIYTLVQENAKNSILYHSMDFLPSELPRDASNHFSNKLFDYVVELAADDANTPFEDLQLNPDIKNGIMTCHGKLTPNFEYITELRRKNEEAAKSVKVENKSISEIIGKIVDDCPELVSDIRNAAYHQEMCPESKEAILRIAKLLES
jgi:alpha-aminoadipic semialdehyde synthase